MNDTNLTSDERQYLQQLFWEHGEKVRQKLSEELLILSKYKGELARNYEVVGAHHNTLIGCMKDILSKQDELIGLCRQLGDMAYRIESCFLKDIPPKTCQTSSEIDKELLKEKMNLDLEELNLSGRAYGCLKAENINTIGELLEYSESDLFKTPNLGKKSLREIKDELARHGWELKNE